MFGVFAIDEILCYRGTRFPHFMPPCLIPRCQIITCPWITAEFRYEPWLLKLCFLKLGFHWNYLFSLKLSQAGRGQLMQDFVHYTQSYPSNSKRPGCFKTILIPSKSAPITSFLLLRQWLVCFSLSNRCWIWHLLCQVTSYVQWGSCWRNPLCGKNNCQKTSNAAFFQIWRYHLASCGIGSGMCH